MSLNMTDKILKHHLLKGNLRAGSIIEVKIDRIMVHESIAQGISEAIEKLGAKKLKNPENIISVLDHFSPAPDENAAIMHQKCREFVKRFHITHHYDIKGGICHQVMIEDFVEPGQLIIGSDSHSTTYGALGCFGVGLGFTDVALAMVRGCTWIKVPQTIKIYLKGELPVGTCGKDVILYMLSQMGTEGANYKALEFSGPGLKELTMDDRFSICNMAAETGAKAAVMPVDSITRNYLHERMGQDIFEIFPEPSAQYSSCQEINLSNLTPMVAKPNSPDNVCSVNQISGIKIDQVFIGGCNNGRLSDLRQAATILKGKKIASSVRLLVYPASYRVLKMAIEDGTLECLIDAGAVLGPPCCGPCFGAHLGLLGPGERCFSVTNRNFLGRMGSKKAEIYLGSPFTAAATALNGRITDPRQYVIL